MADGRAMKDISFLILITGLAGCGRLGIVEFDRVAHDGAPSGGHDGATPPGNGGKPSSHVDAASSCPTTAFSTAPIPCSYDWSHAKISYKSTCKRSSGGYQATCAPYDAIAYTSQGTDTWCFYAKQTGNLIGSFERGTTGSGVCKSFDLDFSLPAIGGCAPVSGGACGPDAGP